MLETVKRMVVSTPFGNWYSSSEYVLKRSLRYAGAAISPRKPKTCWMNTTLHSDKEMEQAVAEVIACGLPPHESRPKNWDAVSALHYILARTNKNAAILEVGATLYSVMLPWLYLFGYRNLRGIDLVFDKPVRRGPIRYEYGDLTATRFGSGSFDVIVSLSVIEHGVNIEAYFRELSRLLRPSGLLITSTDYWMDPIDTRGQIAYGVPIKIFTRSDIETMLATAQQFDLWLTSELDLYCDEKVVDWDPLDLQFTFICFALEKRSSIIP
jgi:SAM-dependent methyltransferase